MRARATVYRPSEASSARLPPSPPASARSSSSAEAAETRAPMIWPPSKAISSRICSAMRDELREDAVDGVGMDECDLEAEEALPRLLVDQLRSFVGEPGERRAQVVDLVGDVVHPGPSLRQELPD